MDIEAGLKRDEGEATSLRGEGEGWAAGTMRRRTTLSLVGGDGVWGVGGGDGGGGAAGVCCRV